MEISRYNNKPFHFSRDRHHDVRSQHNENGHHLPDTEHLATPLLTVADFDGNGEVNIADLRDLISHYNSETGDEDYHILYDLDANGAIDSRDLIKAIRTFGADVPLIDRQIARATQATMKYYGSDGLTNALADGYIPFTQEAMGHGIHYYNPALASVIGNAEVIDIEQPVGLNYDAAGNLIAVFYIRTPQTLEPTPENPLAGLFVDPADDFPPESFDTLTADDWHTHQSAWITGVGNLNSEIVYYEEDVPTEAIISRAEQNNFQFFPETDQFYNPKFWMLHGWFHSFNSRGTFAITNPDAALYAVEELGVHGGHDGHDGHDGHNENPHDNSENNPLIAGTDEGEQLFGTEDSDRISGFGGYDWIIAGLGNDSVWGGGGNDRIEGDDPNLAEGGDDMLYGGPGNDQIEGHGGNDRLFGGTEDDLIYGGEGDDLIRGGLGHDIVTGGAGADSFVLVSTEGTDIITDFDLELDTIVLYGGITTETITIDPLNQDTAIGFNNETLAILSGVDANELIAVSDDVFLVA